MNEIEVRDLRDQLTECETVIERGLATFVDVGTALLRIRDERLYRREYGDFESYCRERWGFGRDYADRMITAAAVVPTIVGNGLPAPANEGQARELARVPETERAEVWREAHERTEGKPTAAVVREIRQERTAPAPEPAAEIPGQTSIVDDDADPLPPEIDAEIQRRIESRQRRIAAEADGARFAAEINARTTPETKAWADEQHRRIRAVLHIAECCEELMQLAGEPAEVIDHAPEHLLARLDIVPVAADYLTRFRKELETRA